jgi:hypothetical protein
MVRPPAGNRGSKLVDLGFPVVTRVPWEPEARADPLAWFVEEALSLLSSFEVGVAWFDDRAAAVLRATCDDCSESEWRISIRSWQSMGHTHYHLVVQTAQP